jgi:hypothetical protein
LASLRCLILRSRKQPCHVAGRWRSCDHQVPLTPGTPTGEIFDPQANSGVGARFPRLRPGPSVLRSGIQAPTVGSASERRRRGPVVRPGTKVCIQIPTLRITLPSSPWSHEYRTIRSLCGSIASRTNGLRWLRSDRDFRPLPGIAQPSRSPVGIPSCCRNEARLSPVAPDRPDYSLDS